MAVTKGQVIFIGHHVRKGAAEIVEPAVYTVSYDAIADGGDVEKNFTVDASYDFVVTEIAHANEGVNPGTFVGLKIQVKPDNKRDWFAVGVPFIGAVSSNDPGKPYRLSVHRRVEASKIVNVKLYDKAASV